MAEGYKELEWDCIALQNHNAILNPHIILMQSRNPTRIGEHTAGEYRTRVYVGRGVPWPYVPGLHCDSKIASGLHVDS